MRAYLLLLVVGFVGCTEPADVSITPQGPPLGGEPLPELDTPVGDTDPPVEEDYVMSGFSFVDDVVAGMPQPGRHVPLEDDLAFLVEQDIALVVSLTTVPTDPVAVEAAGMELLHLPIVDMQPPSYEQQVAFVEELQRRADAGERVAVHCTAGLGRTGTMLATWFVAENGDAGDEAISAIRDLRPGSIETNAQEQSVRDFAVTWGQGF